MEQFTEHEISTYYASRVPGLKQIGRAWRGPCPIHKGKDSNFSVDAGTGLAFCHSQCGKGWDPLSLEQQMFSLDFVRAKEQVFEVIGRAKPDWEERDIEATYDYTDEHGKLIYQVIRRSGKRFMQRRPGESSKWTWGLGGTTPLPFQLPRLVKATAVLIVEGEKDVLTLQRLGQEATCNSGGAGNFKPELVSWFAGKVVGIIPDNDQKGRQHAVLVAGMLMGTAASIRIIELPRLPEKGDATDFVTAGGTIEQIMAAYEAAQDWTPEWQFSSEVPNSSDSYIHTLGTEIRDAGGLDCFWDYTLRKGVPTPFQKLSYVLAGGMRPGEVYVLGGNQGSGKTSLALQFVARAASEKVGVHFFSMEMSARDVFHRMIASEARVDLLDFQTLQRHEISVEPYRSRLDDITRRHLQFPLTVSSKPSVTAEYIVEEVKRLTVQRPIGLVVVDHMQLMSSAAAGLRSDYEKFTNISRSMKQAAMEAAVPILLVSQVTRSNNQLHRTELDCSDLRGSGAIEEDAAAVLLLYPDADHKKQTVADGTYATAEIRSYLKLGKNRYGLSGFVLKLLHFKRFTRFDALVTESETLTDEGESEAPPMPVQQQFFGKERQYRDE